MKLINLPNIITCCNLMCGCLAILFGLDGMMGRACLCIILGAVFDFFDGMVARALRISGPIGKELDSLADCITFGVAPAVLCFHIICSYLPYSKLSMFAFVMAAFSALRLAKFNCDERQSLSFIGMPTPANALLWIGLVYLNRMPQVHGLLSPAVYWVLMAVCCYLLISELPMFSLKIKPGHMGWAENKLRYTFLALTAAIIIGSICIGQVAASLAFIILLYIVMSVIGAAKR